MDILTITMIFSDSEKLDEFDMKNSQAKVTGIKVETKPRWWHRWHLLDSLKHHILVSLCGRTMHANMRGLGKRMKGIKLGQGSVGNARAPR